MMSSSKHEKGFIPPTAQFRHITGTWRSATAPIFSPTSSDLHIHCNNKFKLSIKYYLHMGMCEH